MILEKNTTQSLIKLEVNEKNCIVFGKENTYFHECIKVQTCYYEVEAKHD